MEQPGARDDRSSDESSPPSLRRSADLGRVVRRDRLREFQRYDERAQVPRRRFLTGLAAAGIATSIGVQLDGVTVEIARRRDLGWIDFIDTPGAQRARRRFPHTAWVVFPGTSVSTSRHIAEAVAPSAEAYGPMVAMKYPDQFDSRSVVESVYTFARAHGLRRLNFYGQSLGGMIAMTVAAALEEKRIHVDMIISDCSPTSFGDIRYVGRPSLASLAERLNAQELYPGLFTEVGVNYIGTRRGLKTYDDIAEAVSRANRDESFFSASIVRKAAYIAEFNFQSAAAQLSGTKKLFIRPRNAGADHLVNVAHAGKTYRDIGAEIAMISGITHANPTFYRDQYNEVIAEWCKRVNGVGGGGGHLLMR
jgi:pimeloyl-ACP methyl ester carboxylesterase